MAVDNQAAKRQKTTDVGGEQSADRLSSLPDAILIEILSLMPLKSAIATEFLSTRWHGLWTNVTSIDIDILQLKTNSEFLSDFDRLMSKLTSPFIHNFAVKYQDPFGDIEINPWLRRVCQRQLRHLTLQWPKRSVYYVPVAPRFIFQTPSLVSIKLDSAFGWILPYNEDPINLPNLTNLSLRLAPGLHCKWLEKLNEGCPSLENLSLEFVARPNQEISITCLKRNLRWLSINLSSSERSKVVINAPNLEYLAVRARLSTTISYGDKPCKLHEAKIEVLGDNNQIQSVSDQSYGCYILNSKFYKAISNVRMLTLNLNAFTPFASFRKGKTLTLNLELPCDFDTVVSNLVNFPKLNVLILKFGEKTADGERWTFSKGAEALRRVKNIEIETCCDLNEDRKEYFTELVQYLVKKGTNLKRLSFSVVDTRSCENEDVSGKVCKKFENQEYLFCCVLDNCPRVSMECEVSFTGRYLQMARKASQIVLRSDGDHSIVSDSGEGL